MTSFFLRKGQEVANVFREVSRCECFASVSNRVQIRVKTSRHIVGCVYFFAILAIFLNCGIKSGFCFSPHEVAEINGNTFNRRDGFFNFGVVSLVNDRIKTFKCGEQLTSEIVGSLVESGFSVCCIGQMEPYPCQCKDSGNSEKPNIPCRECQSKDFHFSVAVFSCFVCFACGWGIKSLRDY